MRPILVIDIETTGTDPKKHGIIEIAGEFHKAGEKPKKFQVKFFNPKREVDLEALKINKVAYSHLFSLGSEEIAVKKFVDWLLELSLDSQTRLVGHNVHFDVNFLKHLVEEYNVVGFNSLLPYKVHDTSDRGEMLIDNGLITTEGNKSSLKHLAKGLNISIEESKLHGAAYDVELTVKVYTAMNQLLKDKNGTNQ